MKRFLIFLFGLSTSSLAFAGAKDLNLLNAMTSAWASEIVIGNQVVAKISNVTCSGRGEAAYCTFHTAIEADVDETTTALEIMHVTGVTAERLLQSLIASGAEGYEARNGKAVRLKEVVCTYPFRPREFPTEAETKCSVKAYK
jgi:hypothetical protein